MALTLIMKDLSELYKPIFMESFNTTQVIPEAASGGVLSKKVFLEISRNSQENTCARVYF